MASCRSTKHDADQNQGCGVALLLLSQQTWLQPQAMIGRYASASDASHAKKCTKHLQSSGKHSIDQKHDVWASKKTCAVYLDVGNHTNGSQSLFCRGLGQFIPTVLLIWDNAASALTPKHLPQQKLRPREPPSCTGTADRTASLTSSSCCFKARWPCK